MTREEVKDLLKFIIRKCDLVINNENYTADEYAQDKVEDIAEMCHRVLDGQFGEIVPISDEEKAKAYDEAIERAQKATRAASDVAMDIIQYIFPELKESEDERTRKYILKICKETIAADDEGLELSMETTKRLAAYLEKQKEQKPAKEVDNLHNYLYGDNEKSTEENEQLHDIVIAELSKYNATDFWKAPWALDSTGLRYPLYFANLGAKWQKEQKPAEWGEEDEEMLKDIICSVTGFDAATGIISQNFKQHEKKINFLKSLCLQPKAEWSKEDEKNLYNVVEAIKYTFDVSEGTAGSHLISWVKSLRPQSYTVSIKDATKIKGWVAVDSDTVGNRRVLFFPQKPVRDLLTEYKYWAATRPNYEVIRLKPNAFPDLQWEDEPIEVELTIKPL